MNRIPLTATVSLVAAPVVLLIARTLNVPWPGDSGPEKVGKYVQHVADAPDRSDLGAALVLLGALVLLPGVLYLGGVARSRMPRLGAVATALTVTGCVGIAVVGAISVVDGQIVRHSPPSAAVAVISQYSSNIPAIDALVLVGALGFVLLAIALFRSRPVPRVSAVLIGLGGAATVFTSEGPIRALLLLAVAVLLAGQSWAAVAGNTATPAETTEQSAEPALKAG